MQLKFHLDRRVAECRGRQQQRCVTVRAAVVSPQAPAPSAEPHWKQALAELDNKKDGKLIIAQVAPSVRVSISEAFGLPPGATTPGQLTCALKKLGFDYVFDLVFAADLTIMEEGSELIHRLDENLSDPDHASEPLPMFTSCCPGWINLMEKSYPELIPHVSTCRSPQAMMGSIIKTFFAEKNHIQPSDISVVSIMPCVRKQGEADRPWFANVEGVRDVDHVITAAELGPVLKERGIDLPSLPEQQWDHPLGAGSGAGVLFGTTGGVMEAALRTAYELITGQPMDKLTYTDVRGMDGIKESKVELRPAPGTKLYEVLHQHKQAQAAATATATATAVSASAAQASLAPTATTQQDPSGPTHPSASQSATTEAQPGSQTDSVQAVQGGQTQTVSLSGPVHTGDPVHWDGGMLTEDGEGLVLRVAVCHGLGNAKKLISQIEAGEAHYDFIEIMACPAGCVGGGGQPKSTDKEVNKKRQQALYSLDAGALLRRSHENPEVQELYKQFLEKPLSDRAKKLLHTHFVPGGVDAGA